MNLYGYARISSKDQNETCQIAALKNFGVEKIFVDRLSGKISTARNIKNFCESLKLMIFSS